MQRTDSGENNDAGFQFTANAGANSGHGMGGIWFKNSLDGNAYALIRARTDDATGTSGRLDFITSTSAVNNSSAPSMRIDSSGRVGIGTSSPASKLSVAGDIKTTIDNSIIAPYGSLLGFVKKSGSAGSIAYASGQSLIFSQSSASSLSDASAETYTERMRIDSSGRVMIAETSNSGYSGNADDLIVGDNGSATERGISLGSTLASTIRFNDGSDAGVIEYVHSDNSMRFGTDNGTERMRIDSSGNLLVGTSVVALADATSGSGIALQADGQLEIARAGTGTSDVCAR